MRQKVFQPLFAFILKPYDSFYMCKDIFLDRTSKTIYNHLAYMFSFTFIVNIHISKYKKGEYV